jgi:predicted nucleic acid-binding protein
MYALDSNIVSYFLKKDSVVREKFLTATTQNNRFVMPAIVYFEVKRWLLERGAKNKEADFSEFCQSVPLGEFDKRVWHLAASIYVQARKKGKPIDDDADLLIAAFCIVNGYTLVTNNTRHFENIDGLDCVNWKEQ